MFFKVKSEILRNGAEVHVGETIELAPEEAAEMPWAVEPIDGENEAESAPEGEAMGETSASPKKKGKSAKK